MVKQLDHLNLTVSNLAETERWYGDLFGFERVEGGLQGGKPWAILKAGEALLCLYEAELPKTEQWPDRTTQGLNHFALRITDRPAWEAALERTGTPVSYGGEVDWAHSASWYVYDPTGHEIEVALWKNDQISFD